MRRYLEQKCKLFRPQQYHIHVRRLVQDHIRIILEKNFSENFSMMFCLASEKFPADSGLYSLH